MSDDDEDESLTVTLRPMRWSWASIPLAICTAASGACDAFADAFGDLGLSFASHIKYEADRAQFAREAGLAIERITDA